MFGEWGHFGPNTGEEQEPTDSYKMMYIEIYIHYRKQIRVSVQRPRSVYEEQLLDHMYQQALSYMTSIGKKINVRVP